MECYGFFSGGYNYSNWVTHRSIERFDSLKHAKNVFEARAANIDRRFPCVDSYAEMHLFFEDPRPKPKESNPDDFVDPGYPDRIITLGTRGGIKMMNL